MSLRDHVLELFWKEQVEERVGFFGTIRNQVAHRDFRYPSNKEAFQALMLLDYLTEKLDQAAVRLGTRLD